MVILRLFPTERQASAYLDDETAMDLFTERTDPQTSVAAPGVMRMFEIPCAASSQDFAVPSPCDISTASTSGETSGGAECLIAPPPAHGADWWYAVAGPGARYAKWFQGYVTEAARQAASRDPSGKGGG